MHRQCARLRDGLILLLAVLLLVACGGAKATVSAPSAMPAPQAATIAPAAAVMTTTNPTARPATMAAPAMTTMRTDVPPKVYDTLRYVQTHGGNAPPGYQGNTVFENREGLLPPGQYHEYDVDPKMPGVGRNAERLVINQGTGQAYYTRDHYATFILIAPGR